MTRSTVKSVRRVFDVLELFARARRPLSLKEVCGAFGFAPSSGAALLKSLVALGYLDYDRRTRSYFPTMRLAVLGQWIESALFGGGKVLSLMKRLHKATGETVMLATQSDLSAQYVHSVGGPEPLLAAVPVGTLRPLANSGMGWLLLSRHSEADIEKLCRASTSRPASGSIARASSATSRRFGGTAMCSRATRCGGARESSPCCCRRRCRGARSRSASRAR